MKTKISITLLAGIFALLFATPAMATNPPAEDSSTPPTWELLGKRLINWGLDHDEISAVGQGVFTAIKLQLKGGPVNIHKCVIHFGDGSEQDVELRAVIPMGGESRIIDLAGNKRIITRISLTYDTKNHAPGKAVIGVWGRH